MNSENVNGKYMISEQKKKPQRHQGTKYLQVLNINLVILVNPSCLRALVANKGFVSSCLGGK